MYVFSITPRTYFSKIVLYDSSAKSLETLQTLKSLLNIKDLKNYALKNFNM